MLFAASGAGGADHPIEQRTGWWCGLLRHILSLVFRTLRSHPEHTHSMVIEKSSAIRLDSTKCAGDLRRILVLDTETTGLDHQVDELIGLALIALEVDRSSGAVVRIVDRFQGQQEPVAELAPQATLILGYDRSVLVGHRLDVQRITDMVEACDLVVAHNAHFDRPFVEKLLPAFCTRQWACSLRDIDWWQLQAQEAASVEYLAQRVGHSMEVFSPEATAEALVHVLSQPLPVTRETGFAALMAVAEAPFSKFVIPDPRRRLAPFLCAHPMVYSEQDLAWTVVVGGSEAETFQDFLVDFAVFDRRIKEFRVEQLNPLLRFSAAEGGYI